MIEYEDLRRANAPYMAEALSALQEVVQRGQYILGQNVVAFEEEFAYACQAPHCVGVGSGFDALSLSLRACELEPGAEVIVPSNTYIATILSILHNQLVPTLVEPDIATYNIDPARIEAAVGPRTRAVCVVHLYGKCCDMEPICAVVARHGLRLIEDCAQAHGALCHGRPAGTFGDLGAFSFYPTKNLGALGDAGAVITGSAERAHTVKTLRNYGSSQKYLNEKVGVNSRLDELQAAFLRVKLRHLGSINRHKRRLAAVYFEMLKDDFVAPSRDPDFVDVHHIFNVRHARRDALREFLLSNGVRTEVHYPVPPHRQEALRHVIAGEFPISEEIHATTVSLPISTCHSEDDIRGVCEAMNRF